MPERLHKARRSRGVPTALAVVGTTLLLYAWLTPAGHEAPPRHEQTAQAAEAAEAQPQTADRASAPARIRIPAIGVDASVGPLGLQDDGSLQVPNEADEAGWWSGGARPGQPGPAVIVAHRDSTNGPALFYELPTLDPGSMILVEDSQGRQHQFHVDRVERHSREAFPTSAVYGPTAQPTLRLLTCGGEYDRDKGYADNYIVFASAA